MNKDAVAEMSQQYQVETAEKLVPLGYKQTEVGVIPEDWEVFNLSQITEKSRPICYGIVQTGPAISNGIPCLRVVDISDGKVNKNNFITTSQEISESYKRTILKSGDLVIPLRGKVGEVGLIDETLEGANLTRGVALIALQSNYAPEYIKYYLSSSKSAVRLLSTMNGSALQEITIDNLRRFQVSTPQFDEQAAIANALSDTDALLSELEKLIAKKQAIKTATMQQLLTGRTRLPQFALQQDGSPKGYKQSELGAIPEDWGVVKLGEIAKFLKGTGLPKSELVDSGKIRCIHYGQLFTVYGPRIEHIHSSTNFDGPIQSDANDVLMPTSDVTPNGLATASCILESGVVLGGDILIIRSRDKLLDGVFFAYLITIMRDQVMQLVTGSTVYHLYGSDMAKFFFAKPPIKEQTAIATILSDMDEEIQALEQRLNKTRQIKQGMMQELLTGKTRLVAAPVSK